MLLKGPGKPEAGRLLGSVCKGVVGKTESLIYLYFGPSQHMLDIEVHEGTLVSPAAVLPAMMSISMLGTTLGY